MPLTDTFVRQVKPSKPNGDKHGDGGGMYLLVKPTGKYWRLDYRHLGKRKTLALGVYPAISLAKARKQREDARELIADGIDPSVDKREKRRILIDAAANTFEAVARLWLQRKAADRAASTESKLNTWLEKDAFPYIGNKPISSITPRDVLVTVQKMEARGALVSAHKVKQICGQVFRFGVASGLVERDVTAGLRGALSAIPKRHYAALTEPPDVARLLRAIYAYNGHAYAIAALKLTPMLFVRPGELRTAEWSEFDLDAAEWRIPAHKMKMKTEHVVPLAKQAVAILHDLRRLTGHKRFFFPSIRTFEHCMSEHTINAALRGMGYSKVAMTAHGFRATARTILDEILGERVDFIEHQLAHAVKDTNGRAYNRTAHLPARKEMMQRWADYLDELRENPSRDRSEAEPTA